MNIRTQVLLAASTMAVVAFGMVSALPVAAQASAKVTGTISYRDRSALPDNAEVTVQLADVSRQDSAATVLAEQKFTTGGKQVPFSFELNYDPAKIDERFTYAVQATITVDGRLLYRNTQAYLVVTQGRPTNIDLLLQRVGDAAPQPTAGATTVPVAGIGGGYKVSGTVSLLERIALPENNVEILVQLVDVANPNDSKLITEQRSGSNGQQAPFRFDLIYNPALVNDTVNYVVQASISIDGNVTYRSTDQYRIAPQGRPVDNVDNINVIVRRVQGDDTRPTASAPITILPVTPTPDATVAGRAAPTNTAPRTLPATAGGNNMPLMLAFGALVLLAGGTFVRLRMSRRS